MAINIIKEKCIGCGQCFKSCPKDAFYFEPYDGVRLLLSDQAATSVTSA